MLSSVSTSELSASDPFFRTLHNVRSKRSDLQRQWDFVRRHDGNGSSFRSGYAARASHFLQKLQFMEAQLDNSSTINHTALRPECEASERASGQARPTEGRNNARAKGHSKYKNASAPNLEAVSDVRKLLKTFPTRENLLYEVFGMKTFDSKRGDNEPWIDRMLDDLKEDGISARVAEMSWRIVEEMDIRTRAGWFVVFNTLTVDNEHYDRVFDKGSLCWREYCRKIDRAIGVKVHGSVRKAEAKRVSDPYHSYFAVVERGSKRGRLHIHVLHCFRDMPDEWKRDPNFGRFKSTYRCVPGDGFASAWPFGYVKPIACRFGEFDAFGEIGWRWPVKAEGDSFVPIDEKPPLAMARYVCKYLTKSYDSQKGMEQWRTRVSRGYGLSRMRNAIAELKRETVKEILRLEGSYFLTLKDMPVPNHRFRVELLRDLLNPRMNVKLESSRNGWPTLTLRKLLMEVKPRPPIVERLRSLMNRTTDFSSQSFGNTDAPTLSAMAVSDAVECFERYYGFTFVRFVARGNCESVSGLRSGDGEGDESVRASIERALS